MPCYAVWEAEQRAPRLAKLREKDASRREEARGRGEWASLVRGWTQEHEDLIAGIREMAGKALVDGKVMKRRSDIVLVGLRLLERTLRRELEDR